jgi:hypothetical protein
MSARDAQNLEFRIQNGFMIAVEETTHLNEVVKNDCTRAIPEVSGKNQKVAGLFE